MRDSLQTFDFDFAHPHDHGHGEHSSRSKRSQDRLGTAMDVEHPVAGEQSGRGRFGNGFGEGGNSNFSSNGSNSDTISGSPQSQFTFTFPSSSSSQTTPTRRRQPPPSGIPNFPSAHEPRNPQPAIPFSPSPTQSPAPRSPFRSPDPPTPLQYPDMSRRSSASSIAGLQPFAPPGVGVSSPWLSLAASSGAPTPSLESGPVGRGSPHLGYPFERLNIGGSWSGANLWGEGAQGRRGSEESSSAVGSSPIRSPSVNLPPPSLIEPPAMGGVSGGLSSETLARYRAMAGKRTTTPSNNASGSDRGEPKLQQPVPSVPAGGDSGLPSLPALLARRRASLPKNTLGPLAIPGSHIAKGSSPLASSSSSSVSPPPVNKIQPISPTGLKPLLSLASTLILDVRPPSSFQSSHIPRSHSLPIPSTLLRRPAFTLQKLSQMLAPSSQQAVAEWKEKQNIVILDVDSGTMPAGGAMDGLAAKFEREGFAGQMWFVKGGHAALVKSGDTPMVAFNADSQSDSPSESPSEPGAKQDAPSGLMARRLGNLAFRAGSPANGALPSARPTGLQIPPTPSFDFRSSPFGISMPTSTSAGTARPQGLALSRDAAFHGPTSGGFGQAKLQPANPFFDNIRQNLELSHGGITERIPLGLPDSITERSEELPSFLRDLVNMPENESMDVLAKQFYSLERSEQKRLQSVMDWHSKGSGGVLDAHAGNETLAELKKNDAAEVDRLAEWTGGAGDGQGDYYPFSITAGVERGSKNRYKNIWPYDFSRVRLESPPDEESDYINASFVQPRGTNRRYIATQGPLDATFADFWTLVWEQDVHVIVMITKQYEGGLMKCGNYWQNQVYGPIRVNLVSQNGGEDQAPQATTGFDFGPAAVAPSSAQPSQKQEVNIVRVFDLSREDKPEEKPRRITQIQCTGWPDFDVPESPEILLNLIREVDTAVQTTAEGGGTDRKDQPPVLVHCSAGVGRTGSFIAVDAILDGLRNEHRKLHPELGKQSSYDSIGSSVTSTRPIVKRTISAESSKSGHLAPRSILGLGLTTSNNTGSSDTMPTIFSSSPAALPSSAPIAADSNLPLSASNVATLNKVQEETMDVDQSNEEEEAPPSPPPENHFNRHRGSIAASSSSEVSGTRRPSIASHAHSSDSVAQTRSSVDRNAPAPLTKSNAANGMPSPLSSMVDPISTVLHGMRVQRMSLVQTLRQYLFVHRAIIQNYLHMLDDDEVSAAGSYDSNGRMSPPFGPRAAGTASTSSAGGTDDEAHAKRRASPTELRPEHGRDIIASEGSSLTKRASFKKMRQGIGLEGLAPGSGGVGPSGLPGSALSTSPASPKRVRVRRGSKLVASESERERERSQGSQG